MGCLFLPAILAGIFGVLLLVVAVVASVLAAVNSVAAESWDPITSLFAKTSNVLGMLQVLWAAGCLMAVRAITIRRRRPDTYWTTVLCLALGACFSIVSPALKPGAQPPLTEETWLVSAGVSASLYLAFLLWFALSKANRRYYGIERA